MKLILSRKGFDGSNGGCASPIFPNDTMLSLPIPSKKDSVRYDQLYYKRLNYADILRQINPRRSNYSTCHLDPDIRPDLREKTVQGWKTAFGQSGAAQKYLQNASVEKGDLFCSSDGSEE